MSKLFSSGKRLPVGDQRLKRSLCVTKVCPLPQMLPDFNTTARLQHYHQLEEARFPGKFLPDVFISMFVCGQPAPEQVPGSPPGK